MRVFASLIAVLVASTASAQPSAEPLPPPVIVIEPIHERVGLELGGGLWGGNMYCKSENGSCNGFAAAGGGNLEASWFFTPTLGITADAWVMAHTENDLTLAQYINTIGVKWRPIPILTLQAGLGEAHAAFSYGNVVSGVSADAPAGMLAASLEVIRGRRWALAIAVRGGTGFYGEQNGMPAITARNVGAGAELTFFRF